MTRILKNTSTYLTHLVSIVSFFAFSIPAMSSAQEVKIQWLSFEQLEDSLAQKPKKVFINFYADWCAYCKKMDEAAFKDSKVVSELSNGYYAVKMNAESKDTISFGEEWFVNKQLGKSRNPTHQIPLLLASRENRPFSVPAMVFLNQKFEVTDRYFEYLTPKELLQVLEN